MFTERMKKLELLVLKRDMDDVLRYLGFSGCVQLITENRAEKEPVQEEREITDLRLKVESICRFLGIEARTEGAVEPMYRERMIAEARNLIDGLKDMLEEESRLLQQKLNLKQTADELSAFANLKVSFSELEHLTYLSFRLGSVDPERVQELSTLLEKRALIVRLNKPGFIMAIAPKKGRWALDSELKKFGFQETRFPADLKGVPAEVLPSVIRDLEAMETALGDLERRKVEFRAASGDRVSLLMTNLNLAASIDTVKQGFASTGSVNRLSGWVPERRFTETVEGLAALTQERIAIRSYEPEELPDVKSGKTKVPVVVKHGPVVRSFERMVFSYSVPLYGTIDPTPFVAAIFVVLFSIMFGDVGQGFIGLLIGLLITSGRFKGFEKYKRKGFGTIFIIVGIASMITGFLYGSFFSNEEFLIPITRTVTQALTGTPVDRILVIQGTSERILSFFAFTLGVGVVINSIGLAINIINNIRQKRYDRAFLTKTGLAGALFFWYVLFFAVRIVLGGKIMALDFVFIALPLLVILFQEPIFNLLSGHRPLLHMSVGAFLTEGIVEILESVIYYISNSVSFLRVAAFAMAHAVLSFIVFFTSGLVASAPGGIVYQILIYLIGNTIIIVLEGLIVTIQVVRLQYYEFFSKFFAESGEEFRPFNLYTSGGKK